MIYFLSFGFVPYPPPPFPRGDIMPKKVSFPFILLKIQHCFEWGVGGGGGGVHVASFSNISGKVLALLTSIGKQAHQSRAQAGANKTDCCLF